MSSLFFQRLDTTGDGSGTTNMAVNGSSTSVVFKIKPDIGEIVNITRIMVYIEDAGTFDSGKWGNAVVLTNGINFSNKIEDVVSDILGFNIKTHGDMSSVCFDISHETFGSGNEFVCYRWTFTKAGDAIQLQGEADGHADELQVTINDDMTDLVSQYIVAQGYYE